MLAECFNTAMAILASSWPVFFFLSTHRGHMLSPPRNACTFFHVSMASSVPFFYCKGIHFVLGAFLAALSMALIFLKFYHLSLTFVGFWFGRACSLSSMLRYRISSQAQQIRSHYSFFDEFAFSKANSEVMELIPLKQNWKRERDDRRLNSVKIRAPDTVVRKHPVKRKFTDELWCRNYTIISNKIEGRIRFKPIFFIISNFYLNLYEIEGVWQNIVPQLLVSL